MRDADLIRCVFTGAALEPDGNFAAAALHDRLGGRRTDGKGGGSFQADGDFDVFA